MSPQNIKCQVATATDLSNLKSVSQSMNQTLKWAHAKHHGKRWKGWQWCEH